MATNKDVKPQNPVVNRSHPLAKGLVGAWPFFEGGGPTLRDITGYARNGTPTNITHVTGEPGRAYQFNGSSSKVILPATEFGFTTESFTVALWLKPGTPQVYAAPIFKRTSGSTAGSNNTNGYSLEQDGSNTNVYKFWGYGTGWIGTAAFTLTTDAWQHVVVVRSGTDLSIYVNGVQVIAISNFPATLAADASESLRLGRDAGENRYWKGEQADVRIYDRELTSAEILDSYVSPWQIYHPARPIIKYFYAASAGTPHSPQSDIILLDGQSAISTTYPLAAEGLIVIEERLFRRQRPVAGDRLVFADPIKVQQGKLVIASDGLSLTENFSLYVGPLHEVREQEGIEISEVGVRGFLTDLGGDRIGLDDICTPLLLPPPVLRTGSDGLILSDYVTPDLSLHGPTLGDGIKLSDPAPIVTLTFIGGDPTPEDGLILTEQGALQQGYSFDIDTIHLSETIIIALNRAVTDNILLGENIAIGRQVSLQSSDVVEFSEAGLLIEELHFDLDGVTLTEIVTLKLEYYLYPAETILLNDQTTVRVNYGVPVQDGIKLAEAIVDPEVSFVEEPLDAILLADQTTVRVNYGVPVQDGIKLAEAIVDPEVSFVEEPLDAILLADQIIVRVNYGVPVQDGIKLAEAIVDPRVYFVEEPLDAILLTDEIKVRMGYGIPLTDAVRLADVEATGVQHGRRAYEGISFGDSSQTLKTQHRNIGDGVKIGEKILKNQLAIGSTVRLQGTIEDLLILTATIR